MITVLRIARKLNMEGPVRHYRLLHDHLPGFFSKEGTVFRSFLAGAPPEKHEEDARPVLRSQGLEVIDGILSPDDNEGCMRTIERLQPDLIHTHGTEPMHALREAVVASGIPSVHTFHGHAFRDYHDWSTERMLEKERQLTQQTHAIIVLSPSQYHDVVHTFSIAKAHQTHIVPVVPDQLTELLALEPTESPQFRIGIVARLEPVKHHVLFLQAIELLDAMGSNPIVVHIIGDGSARSTLEQKVSAMRLKRTVIFFDGWRTNLCAVYQELDTIVLTSKSEGTPLCLIEGQAASLPVVATSVGGVPDCLLQDESGFLVPSDDKEMLAKCLFELECNRPLRRKMGLAGRRFVQAQFSVTEMIAGLAKLYNKVLMK